MRYDYFCPTNQQILEVNHGMSESVQTWGELCDRLEIEAGDTPLDAPVERVISGGTLALPRRVSKDDGSSLKTVSECVPRSCCGPMSNCCD